MNNFDNQLYTEQQINISSVNIEAWWIYAFWIFLFFVSFSILKRTIKYIIKKRTYNDHQIFLIKIPKDKPGDDKKETRLEELHEEIAKAETIFAAIGGLKAQKGFKYMFLPRDDQFSFEIATVDGKIAFYFVSPTKTSQYFEQQIQAHFPDAVIEKVPDYNIFNPQGETLAASLKTSRSGLFPLKTYKKHETDPMNSLINVLSKIEKNEGLAIQCVVRSAKANWHKRSREVVQKSYELNSIQKALKVTTGLKFFKFFNFLFTSAKPPTEQSLDKNIRLTSMEEEILKGIEEKNAKAGLDINIRIIASAETKFKAQAYLDNIINAFNQYNFYEYGNSFKKPILKKQKQLIKNFIYRDFNEKISSLMNTEELASIYHLPLRDAETPNILWLTAKQASAPLNLPNEGILLGHNDFRGTKKPIQIMAEDRLRHTHIIGKSGGGKSVFIAGLATQDILNGDGVAILDPHGDLIEKVLKRIPPERAEDVVIFSPSDVERPIGLNLMEYDERFPEQRTFVINEVINIFDKLYDLKSTGGPMFEQYMRNAMLLVMSDPESGSTLLEIPKVLSDSNFRKMKLKKCSDPTVVDFWTKEAEKAGGDAALENIVPYITSKLTQFLSNDMMRPIVSQQKSSFNIRDLMDEQKILLVDLPKGQVGETNAYLLGMIMVGKILMAALSRANLTKDKRKNFYLYIDEFQNFTTNSICQIFSEARKYGLGLTVAHQYIGQLTVNNDTAIKDALFGNVGTQIVLRVGAEDAEFMEREFSPTLNQYDLINTPEFTAYIRLLINNNASKPFSLKMPYPIAGVPNEDIAEKIRILSRLKYGKHKDVVETEVKKRLAK